MLLCFQCFLDPSVVFLPPRSTMPGSASTDTNFGAPARAEVPATKPVGTTIAEPHPGEPAAGGAAAGDVPASRGDHRI